VSAISEMLAWALAQRGKPYVFGATGPDAFDCSGLVEKAAAAAGIRLPRTSQEQRNAGTGVPLADIQAGDLVTFTYNDGPSNPGPGNHVALYAGAGHVIEAARPGVPVRVAPLDVAHVDRVRRIASGGTGTTAGAIPADNVTTGAAQTAGLQQTGYDAVIQLTPWGIPLNPFKLPGYIAGKAEGLGGDVAGAAGSAIWDSLGPVLLAAVGVAAGLALAVMGVYVTAKPHIEESEDKLSAAPIPV
jgi:hypothetical protein